MRLGSVVMFVEEMYFVEIWDFYEKILKMDIYNSILLVIIMYLNLLYGNLCDFSNGFEGIYDCVYIFKYDGY